MKVSNPIRESQNLLFLTFKMMNYNVSNPIRESQNDSQKEFRDGLDSFKPYKGKSKLIYLFMLINVMIVSNPIRESQNNALMRIASLSNSVFQTL